MLEEEQRPVVAGDFVSLTALLQGLCRWDCGWFHRIAMDGYAQPHYSNFFPLFPLLGRVVNEVLAVSAMNDWAQAGFKLLCAKTDGASRSGSWGTRSRARRGRSRATWPRWR